MRPIVLLDSGVGGFSVYKLAKELLPNEDFIYIADKKYFPYGDRPAKIVQERVFSIACWAIENKAKMFVLACNTATVTVVKNLRKKYFSIPVIGMVPVIKTCVEQTKNGNIGVICTPRTARSAYQKKLITRFANDKNVYVRSCPGLVELIESIKGHTVDSLSELQKALSYLKNKNIDTLALGCSHFPLVKDNIQNLAGENVLILDSGGAVSRHIKRVLKNNKDLYKSNHKGRTQFYTTAKPREFDIMIKRYLDLKSRSKLLRV